ncbi:MAG: asparaginase [Neisseriaceae bacterium]|nr:asparaginase [Neisseriaceae bacterium]MBO7554750.1 asparaginase [Neisseriaceae bacterium]
MKKIALLYTGGTIGMIDTPQGFMPDLGLPEKIAKHFSGSLKDIELSYTVTEQVIDSSCISLQHWTKWIEITRQLLQQADAVVILHGTDTMAYTAALFRLVFHNTNKAIIFTGSQKAWIENHSDAPDNLLSAISLIQQGFLGVGLVFHQTLFDPADCRKVSTENNQAFSSIWKTPLAQIKNNQWHFFRQLEPPVLPQKNIHINPNLRIATIYPTPALAWENAASLLTDNTHAAIILAYGNGNLPDNKAFLQHAQNFCKNGKPLIILSQVWQGEVNQRYAANLPFTQIGAINGGKHTIENTLAKLVLGLSVKLSPQEMLNYFQTQ